MKLTLAVLILAAAPAIAADVKVTGGNGTLYLGGRPGRIFVVDEATEKVIGEIQTKTGTPSRMTLSQDHKRFYMQNIAYEDMEIADIASRQVIDTFRLSEGNKKVRIFGYGADPLNRYMILLTKTATKQSDRYEVGSPTLLQYDLKEHKVMRTIPWPNGDEREFLGVGFSPDGKLVYFYG
ncbi:MAG TPA: hypothetical protein VGF59_14515, partial [Bryobacteraceae bacterium]